MPDFIYNRPANRKKYLSINKHQATTGGSHSKWLSINVEKDMFDYSDYGNYHKTANQNTSWICSLGNLWAIKEDKSSVGTREEQFGFFQQPVNVNDEWHGYPVIPFSQVRLNICDNLLKRWVADGILDIDDIAMILKKKRI